MKIEVTQAPLIRRFCETMKLLNIYLNHFPKHERYALCGRIRDAAYTVYDLIVEGMKRYHKKTTLTALDVAHERLRMQIYLAFELGYFGFAQGKGLMDPEETEAHRFMAISRRVDELGRMIGAWISGAQTAGAW